MGGVRVVIRSKAVGNAGKCSSEVELFRAGCKTVRVIEVVEACPVFGSRKCKLNGFV